MDFAPPSKCSICGGELRVTRLQCPTCSSELSGSFVPCRYCALSQRHKLFMETFLKCRGNIRDVEKALSISYPTVKGLLDELLNTLFPEEKNEDTNDMTAARILDRLENGEITAAEAAQLLKRLSQ